MSKFVLPGNYTAKHTGKSGFVSTKPRGGAPIPYSFIEEASSNLYPSVRDFIPKDVRKYSDSYYDLRNKQYKYWYDKWGKPHINKWWQEQLNAITTIQNAKAFIQENRQRGNTRTRIYGGNLSSQYGSSGRYSKSKYLRCGKCFLKHRSSGQRPYCKCRSPYRGHNNRYEYKKSYKRWRF